MAGKRKTARERLADMQKDFRTIAALAMGEGDDELANAVNAYGKKLPGCDTEYPSDPQDD